MAVHEATTSTALNPLIAKMKPGDILRLASGVYRQRIYITIPGITITSLGAVIDGSGITGMSPWAELVSIRASNVTVEGITVCNSPGEGIGIGDAASVKLTGCKLLNVAIRNTRYNAFTLEYHEGGVFDGLTISDSAMMNHPSVRKGADWPGGIAFVKGSNNNILRNSNISWVWGEPLGVFWNSNGNIIEDCTFSAHWGPVDFDVAANNIVRRCRFINIDMNDSRQQHRAVVLGNEKGRQAQAAMAAGGSSNGNEVVNCSFENYAIAVGFDQQTGAPRTPDGNLIHFNTIVGGDIGRWEGGGANNIVRNNIFRKGHIATQFRGKAYNNLFWQPTGNTGTDAIIADPEFVISDSANPVDWQIAPTSPAVGKATDGIPATDFFGNPRPTPAALGAHEPTPVVIEPATKGWRIQYMVGDQTFYLPPPPDVGHVLVSIEDGGFEWQPR